jgi:hypothetical protein
VAWATDPNKYDSLYRAYIEVARSTPPYFYFYLSNADVTSTTGSFDLRIIVADTLPDAEITGFISVMEDSLGGAYTTFVNVCRSLYEFPVELAYPDTFDTTITFSHSIHPDKIKAAVFFQNMNTKEIMQSIMEKFEED